ncbi:hypothetical protein CYMTET_29005 [Cymbomonas tetramitiformis]|uniref:LarA-like N-terminal domain-containing protein n=1 Tax=Cymbomonas tetramitiformis TaxID=36881 RepID=A0AAE0FLP3_9CHLO|nr:hypothetical protein CYMTET_29005 [Cymbomonas tetramitiformis]
MALGARCRGNLSSTLIMFHSSIGGVGENSISQHSKRKCVRLSLTRNKRPLRTTRRNVKSVAEASESESYKWPPRTFNAKKGEKFVFQYGEGLRIEEVPEGTRIIYPGVRKDETRDVTEWRRMIKHAINNPVGDQEPLREKLKKLKATKSNPKILFAFDDVSLPLPPMQSPDIRAVIMEVCEEMCMEEGIKPSSLEFVCSIALHRFIRPDEFRHVCGKKLYSKYFPTGRMRNYNAVDEYDSVHFGYTRHGEDVMVCKSMAESDLMIYVNVNYVAMDGGYKSYATGMVHYKSLRHNHDVNTLRNTRSLYDPKNSRMHKSFERIGKMIQQRCDIFHIETVLDDNLFPFYLSWIQLPLPMMDVVKRLLAWVTVLSLKIVPLVVRKWIFWSPITWGPFGLKQVMAGETVAVHERTLEANYKYKVVDVQGQCDILIVAPSCIGPYTKDTYMNPLLVNTYALGYYYNMYVDGTPLLRPGGVMIVVSEMHYEWSSPQHDNYRQLFEEVIAPHGGLDEFEEYQEKFATSEQLNDNYRQGLSPAGVHGFYMYTWAAHGMDMISKVYAAGADRFTWAKDSKMGGI